MTNLEKMIEQYNLELVIMDGAEMLKGNSKNITKEDMQTLKAHKEEIIESIKSMKAEKAAKEAATVKYIVTCDWEPHTEYVDTRNIKAELERIANYYGLKIEAVVEDYERQMEQKSISETAKAEVEKELAKTEIPVDAIIKYSKYNGDENKAWEAEDEEGWAMIRKYGPAIRYQRKQKEDK